MAKLFVPEERRLLSGRDRVLYMDGFPVHGGRSTKMKGHSTLGAFVLQAAPRSPDLTVTENL